MKTCLENPNLVTIGQLARRPEYLYCCRRD